MVIVHLINKGTPKVLTFKYKKRIKDMEVALRGHFADIVILDGYEKKSDVPEFLLETLKAVVTEKKGIILLIQDRMERLFFNLNNR